MHWILKLAVFAALACVAARGIAQGPPTPDSTEATQFGYSSPEAALTALRGRPGVSIYQQGGWTVVNDRLNYTLWSFTPPDHPAHPAGVKRVIVKAPNGDISIMMTASCGASEAACDELMDEFVELNNRMAQSIRSKK
jgi:hypothetical protein